jgi:alpha-beta hydrolase superfamily lysophospholipase
VIAAATALPAPPVLVGHSMGGLVVQQVLARYAVPAAVLVAPIPAHPAVTSLAAIGRRHPLDATGVRRTAACCGADIVEFPGMGHDLMLDARRGEPLDAMLDWLPKAVASH